MCDRGRHKVNPLKHSKILGKSNLRGGGGGGESLEPGKPPQQKSYVPVSLGHCLWLHIWPCLPRSDTCFVGRMGKRLRIHFSWAAILSILTCDLVPLTIMGFAWEKTCLGLGTRINNYYLQVLECRYCFVSVFAFVYLCQQDKFEKLLLFHWSGKQIFFFFF